MLECANVKGAEKGIREVGILITDFNLRHAEFSLMQSNFSQLIGP